MTISTQVAQHLRGVFFGGNWTSVHLQGSLNNISWQQAIMSVQDCNSIALLVYHMHYYVTAQLRVLQGLPLDAHDKYSFDMPAITCEADWQQLQSQCLQDAEALAALIDQLDDTVLTEDFTDAKYGSYYRNLHGLIEHTHYHLGQIVLLRKILAAQAMVT